MNKRIRYLNIEPCRFGLVRYNSEYPFITSYHFLQSPPHNLLDFATKLHNTAMEMVQEKPKPKKKSKKKQAPVVLARDVDDDEVSTNSGDIGKRLANIANYVQHRSEKPRGSRPTDDLTREISIGPQPGSDDDDDGSDNLLGDDDSKHYGPPSDELGMSQDSGLTLHSIESKRSKSGSTEIEYEVRGAQVVPVAAAGQAAGAPSLAGATPNNSRPPSRSLSPANAAAMYAGVAQLPPLPTTTRQTNQPFRYSRDPPPEWDAMSQQPVVQPVVQPPVHETSRKKDGKSKNRAAELTKAQQERQELARLEPIVLKLTFKHKDRIVCREEYLDGGEGRGGNVLVAKWIELGSQEKGNYKKVDIERFNYKTVQKIAANFGCKGVSALSKQDCRKRMAIRITSGTVYDLDKIASPITDAATKKTNTYVRIINACFLPENVQRFVHLNDAQQRKDIEKAAGGNPIKAFWVHISSIKRIWGRCEFRPTIAPK
jgi:hypothetical protein